MATEREIRACVLGGAALSVPRVTLTAVVPYSLVHTPHPLPWAAGSSGLKLGNCSLTTRREMRLTADKNRMAILLVKTKAKSLSYHGEDAENFI